MEKSKNPLKKAMRRRNAKTVQFTAPTYVEASDYDYSSDEENADGDGVNGGDHLSVEGQDGQVVDRDDATNVAPLKVKGARNEGKPELGNDGTQDRRRGVDDSRASDEMLDRQCMFSAITQLHTDLLIRCYSYSIWKVTQWHAA